MKDISNTQEEFEKLRHREMILHDRLTAVGMDYLFYLSTSESDKKFGKNRDDILYKINGIDFHIQILLNHFDRIQLSLEELFEQMKNKKKQEHETPFMQSREVHTLNFRSTQQVSVLFDSTSVRLRTLINF